MIAALLLLAEITPVPDEPKPIATTIAAIRANPTKFDGQIVRLHGYVNDCETASCNIDERIKTDPAGPGEELSIGKDAKFDAIVRPLVPTYVELDARVDATCILAPCLDRGNALTVVTLRGVVSTEPPPFEKP
jgi:hypothetical protein